MEFKDIRCPVCGVPFDDDDDVVVCPECGTPHHRKCYERLGKCVNAEHHGGSFSWNDEDKKNTAFSICPNCGAKNPTDAIFCNSCANPLGIDNSGQSGNNQTPPNQGPANNQQGMPFGGFGAFNATDMYGAMGMTKEQELASGVTAENCEKYVKTNAFYYLPVFRNIKSFGKGRFNFAAAIFNGAWFLYRKLYLVGALFLALTALFIFTETFFINSFYETYKTISQTLGSSAGTYQIFMYAFENLNPTELFMFILSPLASFMSIVLMIVSGCVANKIYYKNAVKKIQKVKSEKPANLTEALNNAGGTNTLAPALVIICHFAINIISTFI